MTESIRRTQCCLVAAIGLLAAAALLSPSPGRAASAGWSAPQCGHEPQPPVVDGTTVEHYNASIDRVGAYDRAARAYSACVNREALVEQNAISAEARTRMAAINAGAGTVQRRIANNFGTLSAQLHAAGTKLGARH